MAAFDRNGWQLSAGISGRFEPDYAVNERRNKKELKKLRTSPASNRAVKKSIFMSKLLFQGRNRGGVLKIVPNGPFG